MYKKIKITRMDVMHRRGVDTVKGRTLQEGNPQHNAEKVIKT